MRKFIKGLIIVACVSAPFVATASASATGGPHTDPCPGQHLQVYSEVGGGPKGQPTNHFVCGPLKGADGKDGVDGKDGATGPAGPAGPAGPQGEPGTPGEDGADGAKGDTGATGEKGAIGETGAPGVNGTNGTDGVDGVNGTNGVDGIEGAAGLPGADGKDGVTKTVIVENGEENEVPGLPNTGGNGDLALWLILGGVVIAGLGTAAYYYGKR